MYKYLKNKKIKLRFKEDIEIEEILLDSLAQKQEEEMGIEEKKLEVPLSKNLLMVFFLAFLILISFLFIRTFQFQVVEGKKFSQLAAQNKFKIYQIQAERGVIYDRNYNQLVWNSPSFDLFLDTKNLPESEAEKLKILEEVSLILEKDIKELKKEIENSELPEILIQKNLDYLPLILLETKINSKELSGFQIKRNFVRTYKTDPNFSHLIGYTGKILTEELKREKEQYTIFDWVGRSGVEKSYEGVLRRSPGKIRIKRDALGNLISQETIKLPEPGKSLVLWLDSQLQGKIKEELEKQLKINQGDGAVAIALDPKTGGILSLVSLPDFDNNLFQKSSDEKTLRTILKDPKESLFNRPVSGLYAVGSTIKPLIAAAALEENLINPKKQILSDGKIEIPHRYNPDIVYTFRDWKVHGWTDMRKAIADSVNIYFYAIGGGYKEQKGLLPTRIKKYLELFGWAERTGIDLPAEAKGLIPSPEWKKENKKEIWYDGDTYHLSIGQGNILITPLQVVSSFAAIANNGKLFKPKVVQKIIDDERNLIEEIKPELIREIPINSENLQVVREGMREAVLYGSAVMLNSLPIKAAAKTGTAETSRDGHYHHWVTVFAPYDDPEIVLTILIESVKGIRAATLPVAKAVLEWYFTEEKK